MGRKNRRRWRGQKGEKKSRTGFYSALLAAPLILLAIARGDAPQPTFQRAQHDQRHAQSFINRRIAEEGKPFHNFDAVYKEKPPEDRAHGFLHKPGYETYMSTFSFFPSGGKAAAVQTEIYRLAFIRLTECDFDSFLFDHEYQHARQLGSAFSVTLPVSLVGDFARLTNIENKTVSDDLRRIYLDLTALDNQLNKGKFSGCISGSSKSEIEDEWQGLHAALFESDHGAPRLVEYFRSLFYRPWLRRLGNYAEDSGRIYFVKDGRKSEIKSLDTF